MPTVATPVLRNYDRACEAAATHVESVALNHIRAARFDVRDVVESKEA